MVTPQPETRTFHFLKKGAPYDPRPLDERLAEAAETAERLARTPHAPLAVLLDRAGREVAMWRDVHRHVTARARRMLDDVEREAREGDIRRMPESKNDLPESAARLQLAVGHLDSLIAAARAFIGSDSYLGYDAEVLEEFTDAAGRTLRVFRAETRHGRPLDEPEAGAVFIWWVEAATLLDLYVMRSADGRRFLHPELLEDTGATIGAFGGPITSDADALAVIKRLVGTAPAA